MEVTKRSLKKKKDNTKPGKNTVDRQEHRGQESQD